MYYRGANAALLLYDITNASTFEDVRGWLEGMFRHRPLHPHLLKSHSFLFNRVIYQLYAHARLRSSPTLRIQIPGMNSADSFRTQKELWF